MPRVLIMTQVFHPSHDAISQILEDLTFGLAESGLEVHVLTSAVNYMTGDPLPRHEVHKGVRIWRTPSLQYKKGNLVSRALAYGTFISLSGPTLALIPRPDVIMYLSTPPLLGWSARPAKLFSEARTVFVAQDVYPEILKHSGHLNGDLLMSFLSRFDRGVLSQMDRVVVLGESMKNVITGKGVEPGKIAVIENWSVAPGIGDVKRADNQLLCRLGIENKFVIQYSGNMGVVHEMSQIMEAASILRSDESTVFLFIGGGQRKGEVEKWKELDRLDNVILLPYQPLEELGGSLAGCDLALISLRPEMEGLVFPSKLYGVLASGRPVVNIGAENGEIARIIDKARCGYTVQTGAQLVTTIEKLKIEQRERQAMGRRAREYFETHYGKERSIGKYHRLITELAAK
jgi:glycosyltransferase involved in cell wall biosynthesis